MLSQLTPYFQRGTNFCDKWGNVASVVGLMVSIIGFIWAIRGIVTAKQAAQKAELAADRAKNSIFKAAAIANFATAIEMMENIKRQIRTAAWEDALAHLAQLRRILVELRMSRAGVDEAQEMIIVGAISQFRIIENKIEQSVGRKTDPDAPKLNGIVTKEMDKLHEISVSIQRKNGD